MKIKSTHKGFDVRAGGDEKRIIYFAWPIDVHARLLNNDNSCSLEQSMRPHIMVHLMHNF